MLTFILQWPLTDTVFMTFFLASFKIASQFPFDRLYLLNKRLKMCIVAEWHPNYIADTRCGI